MNKEWIKISDSEYTLRFHPNDEVDLTATIERDFGGDWLMSCFDLDMLDELIAGKNYDSDTAKKIAEDYVKDYYKELGAHYMELYRAFNDEYEVTIDDVIFCAKTEAGLESCSKCRLFLNSRNMCREVESLTIKILEEAKENMNE